MLTNLNFLSDSEYEYDGGVLPHPGHLLELLDFPWAAGGGVLPQPRQPAAIL